MKNEKSKLVMSWISFISAILVGVAAMIIPPSGIIDSSVLWFIALLLLFTASLLRINYQNVLKTNYNQLTK